MTKLPIPIFYQMYGGANFPENEHHVISIQEYFPRKVIYRKAFNQATSFPFNRSVALTYIFTSTDYAADEIIVVSNSVVMIIYMQGFPNLCTNMINANLRTYITLVLAITVRGSQDAS